MTEFGPPDLIIPFGSNLFHLDNPKCPMNKGVATPVDFVNYAKKFHKSQKNKGFSEPRSLKNIAVMFTDFVGFTTISQQISSHDFCKTLSTY